MAELFMEGGRRLLLPWKEELPSSFIGGSAFLLQKKEEQFEGGTTFPPSFEGETVPPSFKGRRGFLLKKGGTVSPSKGGTNHF